MEIETLMASFDSPVYRRYWQHYQQSMAWYKRHWRAFHKAQLAAYAPVHWHWQHQNTYPRYADWYSSDSDSQEGQDLEESSTDSEIEFDVSGMEISDELRQYFAQTERHREELKKQQQLEAEQLDSYVSADQDLRSVSWRNSKAPPSERPGERRGAEMKKLYGEDSAKIQAMEAAMQLNFDRNCDLKQPKYWPVIPLRL